MSGRVDYYFRQPVTEAELDRGFDLLETADRSIVVDQGLTGVVLGLGVGENGVPDLNVQVASGVAYSKAGERINVPATQTVDMSQDDSAASTAVAGAGNEKWVSLFAVFDRVLSDPRIDGNSLTVFHERAEGFSLSVVQGAEAALGTATRPALDAGKILLGEVLLTFGQTAIVNADIDTTRRETRTLPLAAALYGGGPNWADGTTNPSTDVESQIDKIINDLGQDPDGAARILAAAIAGTPNALSQSSVNGQLGQLLAALNAHINSSAAHDGDDIIGVTAAPFLSGDVNNNIAQLFSILVNRFTGSNFDAAATTAFGVDPGARRIGPLTQAVAWGVVNVDGTGVTGVTLLDGNNVTLPANNDGNGTQIVVNLQSALPSDDYVVTVTPISNSLITPPGVHHVHAVSGSEFRVNLQNFSGVNQNAASVAHRFSFSVHARY